MTTSTNPPMLDGDRESAFAARLDEQRQLRLDLIEQCRRVEACDQGRTDADREIEIAILRGSESALFDVDAAIARMNAGTYGRCVQCGTTLPVEWLQVLPQLASCLVCDRAAR
jgi:RNA polymerase-binding transcription factor DksA